MRFRSVHKIACISQSDYHYRILGSQTLSGKFRPDRFETDYAQWKVVSDFYKRKGLWHEPAISMLYLRLWGIIYDSLFIVDSSISVSLKTIQSVLAIPEIDNLAHYAESFACAAWIKYVILKRQALVLYAFL